MRYRLEAPHSISVLGGVVLESGVEVGDDTPYPLRSEDGEFQLVPSSAMTPLDDEAKSAYEEYAKTKPSWGKAPEEGLMIREPQFPKTPPVSTQPTIPAPIEHFMAPNTMKPGDRVKSPGDLVAEFAARQDVEMAQRANASIGKPEPIKGQSTAVPSRSESTTVSSRSTGAPGGGKVIPSEK